MGATKLQDISTNQGLSALNKHLDNGDKHVFILVFMEECGPCKATRPEWEKISAETQGENVVIADVNSNILDESPIKHVGFVSAFPTIKHVHNGKVNDYNGSDRSKASFEKWMSDSISPSNKRGGGNKRGGKNRTQYKRSKRRIQNKKSKRRKIQSKKKTRKKRKYK